MRNFLKKYNHAVFILYFFIYLPCFLLLEKYVTDYTIIHCPIDSMIPFVEFFIIPYDLWFLYIATSYLFFFFASKKEFVRMASFLTIGMTLFLIISAVFPNGLPADFRPDLDALGRDNIFIDIVRILYGSDTSTNVFPSIHVFNSLGVHIAIHKTDKLPKWIKAASLILCILICMSTVFLKQHSIIDVIGGMVLALILYFPFYARKNKENESKICLE